MATPASAGAPAASGGSSATHGLAQRQAERGARSRAIAFVGVGILAFYWSLSSFGIPAEFKFWIYGSDGPSAGITTSVGVLWVVAGIASIAVGALQMLRGPSFRWRLGLLFVIAPWIAATLAALLDGKPAILTNVVSGSLELSTPITMAALAGILSERSGMFNIALEGKMLTGAFVASVTSSVTFIATGNPLLATFVGILMAMLTAGLVGLLLAWLGIRHNVNQIISGTVINIAAVGITDFIFLRVLQYKLEFNAPPSVQVMRIPFLSDLPVVGEMFFASKPYVYVGYALVIFLTYMIYRTRWGLRLRASGEKPAAAGTVGINVLAIRYRALFYAGLISGLAGSYLALSSSGSFQMQMTAGKGFIGLAAMIFGGWHPVGAFGAALVFGFADSTQSLLSILGVDVPPQLLASIPYVVTIIVVAGLVGRVRGPAAAGQPYEQG
jgi:simple sugar transport system permease protein